MGYVVTDTALNNNTRKYLKDIIRPGFANAPFVDFAIRLGKMMQVNSAEFQQRFVKARESRQTVAIGAAYTAATDNVIAFGGQIFTSQVWPCEFDERQIWGSQIETLNSMFKEKLDGGIIDAAYEISYKMLNDATEDGSTYEHPMVSLVAALPAATTGTYYGVNRATYTTVQHYYATTSAYGGGAAAVVTDFRDPETGFLANLRRAKGQAMQRGANKFVLYCDAVTWNFFGRLFEDQTNIPSANQLAWVPKEKIFGNGKIAVGSIGFDTYVWEGVLIVNAPGVATNSAYLIPYHAKHGVNVEWRYNAAASGSKTASMPFYFGKWERIERSTTWSCGLWTASIFFIGDLSVCAYIVHNGTYDDKL